MNWYEIMLIPAMVMVFIVFVPYMSTFVGELFSVLDEADPNNVFFIGLIKLLFGSAVFIVALVFIARIVKAVQGDSQLEYVRR